MLKSGVRISPVRIEARASSTWVRQRTQLISAIWGHLTEYGWIAPKGPSHVAMLTNLIEEEEMASSLPKAAHAMFRLMLDLLAELNGEVADLDQEIARRAPETGPEEPDVLIVPGARLYDLVPVRELPYGPAASSLHHQRPDRWQHPTTCRSSSEIACISRGVHR